MNVSSRAREVRASVDAVWAVLADFPSIAEWADNADHSSAMTDPANGLGAERRVQAGKWVFVERVTSWEPPHTVGYTIEGMPKVLRFVSNTWTVEPEGDHCQVTLTTRVDAGSLPHQRLIAALAAKRLAKTSDTMLAGLAARVEGAAT